MDASIPNDCEGDRLERVDGSDELLLNFDDVQESRVQEVIGDLKTYLQQPEKEIDLIASETLLEQLLEEEVLSNNGLSLGDTDGDIPNHSLGSSAETVDTHVENSPTQARFSQLNPFLIDDVNNSSSIGSKSPHFNPFLVDAAKDSDVAMESSPNNVDIRLQPLNTSVANELANEIAKSSQTKPDSEGEEVFPRPSLLFPPKGPKYVPVVKKKMVDVACGSEDVVPRHRPTPIVRSITDTKNSDMKLRRSHSETARNRHVDELSDPRVPSRTFINSAEKSVEANSRDFPNTEVMPKHPVDDGYSLLHISESESTKPKNLTDLPEFSAEPYDRIRESPLNTTFNETSGFNARYVSPSPPDYAEVRAIVDASASVTPRKRNDCRLLKTITEEDVMKYDSCVRKVKFVEKCGRSFGEILVGVPVSSQDWEHGGASVGRTSVYSVTADLIGGDRNVDETAFLDESMMRPDVTDVESLQGEGGEVESRLRINHFLVPVLTLEVLILTCLAVLAFYLRFTDEFPVFERAIFCDDKSLRYPYYGAGYATFEVRPTVLYSVCFLLPPILIIVGEVGYWLFSTKPRKVIRAHCNSCKITLTYRRLLRFIGAFLLGALCTSILTDAIKLMAGRPRPYFLSVCDPLSTLCSPNSPIAVLNGTSACAFGDVKLVRHARLSFPSFYAALSSYSAVYTMVYLHNILRMHGTYALRPLLVLLIGGLSLLAGFSRLMAYRNHWQDVLAGFILGSGIAAYFGILLMNLFQEHSPKRRPEMYLAPPEEGSKFFRWFWIPRINFNKNSQRGYGGMYSNGPNDKGPLGPNPAFQQDLHRRIENFGKKNQKQPKHPKQPPPQPPMSSQSPDAQTPEEEEMNDQPIITTMQSEEHQRNSD